VRKLVPAVAFVASTFASTVVAAADEPNAPGGPASTSDAAATDGATDGAADGASAAPSATRKTYSLADALALADKNHPQILAARARLTKAEAQEREAQSAPFSLFKSSGGVGVVPELRGTTSYTPDNDIFARRGAALGWRVDFSGVLPLWTFGKLDGLWDAAEANVGVHEKGVEKERDIVRLDVRRAYYGLLLARDGLLLLEDVTQQLDKAAARLEEKIAAFEGDQVDLFKLRTFSAEVVARRAEAEKFETVALAGLRFYTGVADFDVPDEPLAAPTRTLEPVEVYIAASVENRPEIGQAKKGLLAREALVRGREAGFFPDVGLGVNLGLGVAPGIDDQLSPFGQDPANFFRWGAGLVFQWNLDFVPQAARLDQAEADLAEMHAIARLADEGVATEIRLAHAEVVDWQKRVDAYKESVKFAKKWLIYVQQGIDVGTIEDKELLDPAKAYALGRFSVMNATMELDLAWAKLARASGWDALAPTGVADPAPKAP
jgi:outer membrane protein TolC